MADLDYYRIFYYTAKCGSFTKAAAFLSTSQPNITRCINNLEGSLKCRLFERSSRGVQLTPAGEKLYVHVEEALEALEKGKSEILSETGIESGTVTIGVSENALHLVLIRVLTAYHQAYPAVSIRLRSISTPGSLREVEDGKVDFALTSSPYNAKQSLKVTTLAVYHDCMIAGNSYRNLAEGTTSIAQLKNQCFIIPEHNSATYKLYNDFFDAHHIHLRAGIEVHSGSEMLHLVRNNLGIGFYPQSLIEQDSFRSSYLILHVREILPERTIALIRDQGRVLSPAARVFVEMLLKQHEELRK